MQPPHGKSFTLLHANWYYGKELDGLRLRLWSSYKGDWISIPCGFEFDIQNRLVKTAVTDRVNRSLFEAIFYRDRDALIYWGPPGTGKAETPKDFFRELGVDVVALSLAHYENNLDGMRTGCRNLDSLSRKIGSALLIDGFGQCSEDLQRAFIEFVVTELSLKSRLPEEKAVPVVLTYDGVVRTAAKRLPRRSILGGQMSCEVSSEGSFVESLIREIEDRDSEVVSAGASNRIGHLEMLIPDKARIFLNILVGAGFSRAAAARISELLQRYITAGEQEVIRVLEAEKHNREEYYLRQEKCPRTETRTEAGEACSENKYLGDGSGPELRTGFFDHGLRWATALIAVSSRLLADEFRRTDRKTLSEADCFLAEMRMFFMALGQTRPWRPDWFYKPGWAPSGRTEKDAYAVATPLIRAIRFGRLEGIRATLEDQLCQGLRPLHAADVTLLLKSQYPQLVLDLLKRVRKKLPGKSGNRVVRYETQIEGLRNFAELLPALLATPEPLKDKLILDQTFVALIQYRWSLLRPFWAAELLLFVLLLGCFVGWASGGIVEAERNASSYDRATSRGIFSEDSLGIVCLFLLIPFLGLEVLQRTKMARRLLGKAGTIGGQACDYAVYSLVIVSVLWKRLGGDNDYVSSPPDQYLPVPPFLIAVTLLGLFLRLAQFLRAMKSFGFLIHMLARIFQLLVPFGSLLCIVVLAFGLFFKSLDARIADGEGSASTPSPGRGEVLEVTRTGTAQEETLLMKFWALYRLSLLGDFDSSVYMSAGAPSVSAFFLITLLVNIVMLNVLIAIVSDGYDEVDSRREEESLKQLASTVVELEGRDESRIDRKAFANRDTRIAIFGCSTHTHRHVHEPSM